MTVRVLPAARKDLFAISDYLVENFGSAVALATVAKLETTFRLLAQFQYLGIERPDLARQPIRLFLQAPYWIVYRPGTPLRIYRVYHAARDLTRLHLPH